MFRYLAVITIAAVVLLMLLPTVLSNGQYLQSWWRELRQPKREPTHEEKLDSLRRDNTGRPTGDNKDVK